MFKSLEYMTKQRMRSNLAAKIYNESLEDDNLYIVDEVDDMEIDEDWLSLEEMIYKIMGKLRWILKHKMMLKRLLCIE